MGLVEFLPGQLPATLDLGDTPLSTRRLFFGLTPRRFVGNSGSMTLHSKSVRS